MASDRSQCRAAYPITFVGTGRQRRWNFKIERVGGL
jgi:hypothetical protein